MQAGSRQPRSRPEQGFTLLVLLGVLVIMSLVWAAAGPLWSHMARRDQEAELLRLGMLYARALDSYRDTLPGSIRSYPFELDELLRDPRDSGLTRHLRQAYVDPLRPERPWSVVRDDYGRIVGIYSQDVRRPIRTGPIRLDDRVLPAASQYSDWKFMAQMVKSK